TSAKYQSLAPSKSYDYINSSPSSSTTVDSDEEEEHNEIFENVKKQISCLELSRPKKCINLPYDEIHPVYDSDEETETSVIITTKSDDLMAQHASFLHGLDLDTLVNKYRSTKRPMKRVLMPYLGDYMPAVERPDSLADILGLARLDEPNPKQANLLSIYLKTSITAATNGKTIPSIEFAHHFNEELKEWIHIVEEQRKSRSIVQVYHRMPLRDVREFIMNTTELSTSMLREILPPTAELDCSLEELIDILCGLFDVPNHGSRIQALHQLFSVYIAYRTILVSLLQQKTFSTMNKVCSSVQSNGKKCKDEY
ncbi:unnamed protein product, partial [Didymodactylos carnosus]